MTAAVMIFLLLLAALVQSLIPAVVWLGISKWPCLLAVTLYYALAHTRGKIVVVGILAGIFQDSLSLIPLGYSALCFTAAGLILYHIREMLFRDSAVTVALAGAVSSAATTLCLYVMLRLGSEWEGIPLRELMIKMGGTALLGLVVAPLVWQTAGALERQVGTYHTERL